MRFARCQNTIAAILINSHVYMYIVFHVHLTTDKFVGNTIKTKTRIKTAHFSHIISHGKHLSFKSN